MLIVAEVIILCQTGKIIVILPSLSICTAVLSTSNTSSVIF